MLTTFPFCCARNGDVMSAEHSDLVYKLLNRVHAVYMNDQAYDCERRREEQTERIRNFTRSLMDKGMIAKSAVDADDCILEAEWSGVVDVRDVATDPTKLMTKPSLGWTCQPLECHIEGDLPVPLKEKDKAVEDFNKLPKCCVDIVHIHEDPIGPEAHVHVVCKGVHPDDLGLHVDSLLKFVLRRRGYEVE